MSRRRLTRNRLTRAVNDLRHIHRLTVAQLRDVAARNPKHPGSARINDLIGSSQAEHTRSGLEDAFLRLTRRHGLPIPQINVHVAGFRVDAYFPDHGLIVELDGQITHGHDSAAGLRGRPRPDGRHPAGHGAANDPLHRRSGQEAGTSNRNEAEGDPREKSPGALTGSHCGGRSRWTAPALNAVRQPALLGQLLEMRLERDRGAPAATRPARLARRRRADP